MEVSNLRIALVPYMTFSGTALTSRRYYLVFIIVPAACLPFLWRLPETNGLSLEEIAAKFGDEVAVDLSHLDEERRRALDERLMAVGVDITASPPSEGEVETKETLVTKHQESA
jgi:hypothetical protein